MRQRECLRPAAAREWSLHLSPVDRLLARSALVGAGDYRCGVAHPQFRGGGPEPCPYIVFSRHTVRLLPSRGPAAVCGPATVNLLDRGDSYERRPVSAQGVHCDWIALSPRLLRELAREIAPAAADASAGPFARAVAPLSARVYLAQRQFFDALQSGTVDTLALEEGALGLVAAVLREVLAPQRSATPRCERRNAARALAAVEATQQRLALDCGGDHSLATLAHAVHCSPAHLARSFRRHTGFSLHAYRLQLRLRSALDMLREGRHGGAAIASQLGFVSHSHFGAQFRRHFGCTPREYLRGASPLRAR